MSQPALAQPRNHLVGQRLALVRFDERTLHKDPVEAVEQFLAALQRSQLETLHIELQQCRRDDRVRREEVRQAPDANRACT